MRPFIFLNLAISLDGKISTADRQLHGFGGPEDREMMDELRSRADAILLGGATLREEDPLLKIHSADRVATRVAAGRSPQPLAVIVSPSFSLPDPNHSRFFQATDFPRLIVTSPGQPAERLATIRRFAEVIEAPQAESGLDLVWIVENLAQRGIRQLLLEGGGQLNFAMLQANLIDELNLTLCPLTFGGDHAPTAFGGTGFPAGAIREFALTAFRRGERDRLFLTYRTPASVHAG